MRTGNEIMKGRSLKTITVAVLIAASVGVGGAALAGPPSTATAAAPPAVVAAQVAPAASIGVDLCASDGSITLPDTTTVEVWGFVQTTSCETGLVDDSNFPGPTIYATAGDTVTINLTNALAENTSILIPGQNLAATGGVGGTFTTEAADSGGTVSYSFTAAAGTYLYESGTNGGIQVPMGLYGALVVDDAVAGAYGSGTEYDVEAVLLLSEIDPNLNGDPGGFDPQTYHPTYWLMNGRAYSDTANIAANAGDRVLLRYVNAGFDNLSMMLLGAHQEVIAKQAFELTNSFSAVAEIVPAGATMDVIVETAGLAGSYPLYNRNGYVTNADAYPGGLLTFLDVQEPVGNVPAGTILSPAQGATVFGDALAIQIDATDVEDAAGSLTVEWNVDGGSWQTTSWTGTYYEASWDTTALGDGLHMVNARAADSDGNTTSASHNVIVSNQPAVSIVSPAEGSTIFGDMVTVEIDATDAEDATGTLTVVWDVDGGPSQPATWNGSFYAATLDTTALSDGAHMINAEATDSRSNTATDANNTTVSNLPTIAIVTPADGGMASGIVTVKIDAFDAEDGPGGLTVTWQVDTDPLEAATYNAGSGYYEATLDTTAIGNGGHMLTASAIDSQTPGNYVEATINFTVVANSIHVGDLDGASAPAGGPNWTASVTVTVHAADEAPVQGATVTIEAARTAKSDGSLNLTTHMCVTDVAGQCTVNRSVNSNQYEDTVTFTVTAVSDGSPYSGINHDPDGDSDGTTIVVPR